MFDEYAKKLDKLTGAAPKVFKKISLWGANKAVNEAKEITDRYNKVDTGNYKRNWHGERIEPEFDTYGIVLSNSVEYASFLEYGYTHKGGKRMPGYFIGRNALDNTEAKVMQKLQDEIKILMLQKDYGLTRSEAKKYI